MATASPGVEALDRLLDPLCHVLDDTMARRIADFRLDQATLDRIDELASLCNQGRLSDADRTEYEGFVQGVGLLNVLRAKASVVLISVAS